MLLPVQKTKYNENNTPNRGVIFVTSCYTACRLPNLRHTRRVLPYK